MNKILSVIVTSVVIGLVLFTGFRTYKFCSGEKSSVQITDCSADVLDIKQIERTDLLITDYDQKEKGCEIKLAVDNISIADCNYAHFIRLLGEIVNAKNPDQLIIRFLDGDLTKEGFEKIKRR